MWKILLVLFLYMPVCKSQSGPQSGVYNHGELHLAYNPVSKKVSGYCEGRTGVNADGNYQYSCLLYFEGRYNGTRTILKSYSPLYGPGKAVKSELSFRNKKKLDFIWGELKGACDYVVNPLYILSTTFAWTEIRYVTAEKAVLFAGCDEGSKQLATLSKANVVCIERRKDMWAYVTYFGKVQISGWIKLKELNYL